MSSSASAPIAIVTGASRGAGRGIAIALGSHGCTVYVTGRSEKAGDATMPGTIHETAAAVTAAGGRGIAVRVDHADDAQVAALFEQVEREQGRLDILVNNACAIQDELTTPGNFWEKSLKLVDMIDVGIRSSYVASWHAAKKMVAQQHGLIIFTSASGSVHYVYGPAYGAHKAGMDKFREDFKAKFNADVQVYAPYVYDAVKVMANAMVTAGSADPKVYLPALKASSYNGVTGKIEFDEKGDIKNGALTLMTYKGGNRTTIAVIR